MRAAPAAELVVRPRLSRRLDDAGRVTLVAAMPGYGKSVAVSHWCEGLDVPVAWMSLDLLDGDTRSFWWHLLLSIGGVVPGVADEPQMLLDERGVDDPLFLTALVAAVHERSQPFVLVLDGLGDRVERSVLDGVAVLVEHAGELVRVVVTSRTTPALPLARWRARGWLTEVRQDELCLTDAEAAAVAAHVAGVTDVDPASLNRRVEGWPIAFHMAMLSGTYSDQIALSALSAESERGLATSLVAEVLESLADDEREAVLALSVFQSFDPGLCSEVVGPHAAAVVRDLLRRGMFLTVVDPRVGTMRFHALFRELLEAELAWRDPAARIDLHRRAAMAWRERGDLLAAYHHLSAIGEGDTASAVLLGPVLAMVDRGDLAALNRVAHQLPALPTVTSPTMAIDIALVASYALGTAESRRWGDRARELLTAQPAVDDETALRLLALDCLLDLLDADLDGAIGRIDAHRLLAGTGRGRYEYANRLPIVATRVMLASRRSADARWWLEQAEAIPGPAIVTSVVVPTLRAWNEWNFGRLDVASALIEPALSWMEARGLRAHHAAFDTLITGGWCRLVGGDLDGAGTLAERATEDSEVLGTDWARMQAGFLAARWLLAVGRAEEAVAVIDDLQSRIDFAACRGYADRLLGVEAEALAALDQVGAALRLLQRMEPSPRVRLLRARFGRLGSAEVRRSLADRAEWPVIERLQAEALVLAHRDDPDVAGDLRTLLAECAESGWVLPLVGVGPAVDRLLRSVPLDTLHPTLAAASAVAPPPSSIARHVAGTVTLTERERTLLELLPTHLSYADIGERLYLSVNTVKTNLKSLYRKLAARTRAEAVESAQRHGLL